MTERFAKGERVRLIAEARAVEATVVLASANGCSLALEYEAIVCGFVGMMPVLLGEDGAYRSLAGDEVRIEKLA